MTLSRREFLSDAAIAAAAAAAFAVSPQAARALQDASRVRKVGANERINVAVIGFNGQGGGHLEGYAKNANSQVVAMCDVDSRLEGKGREKVSKHQKLEPKFVQDLRRIMDDKTIDAVSIATPNHWHALAAIWAIQAGKDVYVEKPVSHNVWEGRRIVDFARKHNRIVQTGTQSRSNEGMKQTIDFLRSGKIGKVTLARGLCWKHGNRHPGLGAATNTPIPAGVDYDLWLGPAPEKSLSRKRLHYDWHWFWDYGNGDLGNQGIHEMDKARWGLGKTTLCNAVFSIGGRFLWDDCGETPNSQVCWYDYGDCHLLFETRNLPSKGLLGANVGNIWYGSEGYVVSSNYASGAAYTPKGELIQKFTGSGDHFTNFLDACRSRKLAYLAADIEEGHLSSALCHLGNISHRLGKVTPADAKPELDKDSAEALGRMREYLTENNVSTPAFTVGPRLKFDPKTERFVNHAEADKLLTREYRKGFEVPA